MVGGCCVCSDERGWPENPLVYCDGQNCTVAVHQACYGIVSVPTGVSQHHPNIKFYLLMFHYFSHGSAENVNRQKDLHEFVVSYVPHETVH
jgi:hypothetical protein